MNDFDYVVPRSVGEAVALLSQKNGVMRVLAGGTDLLVQMREGQLSAETLVDIKAIPEVNLLEYNPEKGLRLGAAVSLIRIRFDPDIRVAYPALVDAVSLIGSVQVQGRASVGGNLCNAAPSGDSIVAMIALRATCNLAGPQSVRSVLVESFCTGPRQTVLKKGELLVSINFPPPVLHSGSCYQRFTPRKEMDIAVVGAAAWVKLSEDLCTIENAHIALGTSAPTPLLVKAAGESLVGRSPDENAFAEAARLAQEAARPRTSMRGTMVQRKHLVDVLVQRALREAVQRAKGEKNGG